VMKRYRLGRCGMTVAILDRKDIHLFKDIDEACMAIAFCGSADVRIDAYFETEADYAYYLDFVREFAK
jgi:hypothetical protein